MLDPKNHADPAKKFLDGAGIGLDQNRFVVGTFERGITIYRQQVRALNLVYSLIEAGSGRTYPIPKGAKIAIIGGGAFGVTAAAAAALAGFDVQLFEAKGTLLHLQKGCDTRWVHPHSYDWPQDGSVSELARLPLMDWQAAKASEVADMLQVQVDDVINNPNAKLRVLLDVKDIKVRSEGSGILRIAYEHRGEQDSCRVNAVIYAVGFGIDRSNTATYWRNDDLAQTAVAYKKGVKAAYTVCGFGDGALVDVFRLTIRDFRQDLTLDQMFPPSSGTASLKALLTEFSRSHAAGGFFDRLKNIEESDGAEAVSMRFGIEYLRRRLRLDTKVTLVSKQELFVDGLDLGRISLGNALLAYCLYRTNSVKHQSSEVRLTGSGSVTIANPPPNPGVKIARLGPLRDEVLIAAGLTEAEVSAVKARDGNTGDPIYPVGWWGRVTMPGVVGGNSEPARVENVPRALHIYSTPFASTLAALLDVSADGADPAAIPPRKFRVTLHRMVDIDGKAWFQQVTDYFGTPDDPTGIGRVFPAERGIIGMACRLGRCTLVRRKEEAIFDEVWNLAKLYDSGAKKIRPDVKVLLAWPFFASKSEDEAKRVLFVLFVDSDDPNFLDERHLASLGKGCASFAMLIDTSIQRNTISGLRGLQPGFEVKMTDEDRLLAKRLEQLSVEFPASEGTYFAVLSEAEFEFGKGPAAFYQPRPAAPPV